MTKFMLNNEVNGVEIYFDAKPEASVLSKLHEGKWRWHKFKKCWYNKQTEENIKFAQDIVVGSVTTENAVVIPSKQVVENAHGVKVGDISYTSWGYEQTNVNFYQVIRVTAKRATVRKIKSKIVEQNNMLGGKKLPIKDEFVNEDRYTTGTNFSYDGKSVILKNCDGNNHLGYLFDGKPQMFTCYY